MNLRTARRLKDWTQAELAERAKVKQSAVSDIETGRVRNPSWEIVKRISDALGVEPDELFPVREKGEAA